MSLDLKAEIVAYIKGAGDETSQEVLGAPLEDMKLWVAGEWDPSIEAVSAYVEKVLLPRVQERFDKALSVQVSKAVAELTGGTPTPPQPVAVKPVAAPKTIEVKATPKSEVTVYKAASDEIEVPHGMENLFTSKFIQWMVANRATIPEDVLYQLNDLYFPLGGRNLALCFPCYKFTNPATMFALMALALDLGKEKLRFNTKFGDGLVYHSRNDLAKWFLETGAEWSLWLDDDIIPPIGRSSWTRWVGNLPEKYPEEVAQRHVVTRLLSHDKSIVGGCYFSRQLVGHAIYHEAKFDKNEDRKARETPNMTQPSEWVGTGCLLVHRNVFLDIQKTHPELAPVPGQDYWDFFLPLKGQGEDVAFCQRAKKAGHQPFVDLGLQPLHVGYTAFGSHNTQYKAN